MPPSVDESLPERHLARFVVGVIAELDLRAMTGDYRGSGEASYHPSILLGLLIYGYPTGVFSSRTLERPTHDSVAFRLIATTSTPTTTPSPASADVSSSRSERCSCKLLLFMAREMGVLKLGMEALDGAKIHANASRLVRCP